MEGQAFGGGGNWGYPPYGYNPNANANATANENQFMYDATSAPQQLQLFGNNAVGTSGYYNYSGNVNMPVMNQARRSSDYPVDEKKLKLQMSLNNNADGLSSKQNNADGLPCTGNSSVVSTGLKLSYEDNERNSSTTSGSGSMSLLTTTSFVSDITAEMEKRNKEIDNYFGKQGLSASEKLLKSTTSWGTLDMLLKGDNLVPCRTLSERQVLLSQRLKSTTRSVDADKTLEGTIEGDTSLGKNHLLENSNAKLKLTRACGVERLLEIHDTKRVPIHLVTGVRIIDQILGRNPEDQFRKAAFEFSGLDPHPSSKGFQRSWGPPIIDSKVPEDQKEYVDSKIVDLAEELEKADIIFQQAQRKVELNSRANVSWLWKLIDDRVEIAQQIQKQIGAVGGVSSQEIPLYLIR